MIRARERAGISYFCEAAVGRMERERNAGLRDGRGQVPELNPQAPVDEALVDLKRRPDCTSARLSQVLGDQCRKRKRGECISCTPPALPCSRGLDASASAEGNVIA